MDSNDRLGIHLETNEGGVQPRAERRSLHAIGGSVLSFSD